MDIKKLFGTNKEKETEGTFIPIGGGVEIKMKRAGASNKDFAFDQAKMLRPFSKQISTGTIDPATLVDINVSLFTRHIVTDWKGVTEDGKPVKFSKEKFMEYAKAYPDFFSEIFSAAHDMQNFKDAEDEEIIKKPASSTATD
jgi:hypothetical protein